jgi:hypothetical protein
VTSYVGGPGAQTSVTDTPSIRGGNVLIRRFGVSDSGEEIEPESAKAGIGRFAPFAHGSLVDGQRQQQGRFPLGMTERRVRAKAKSDPSLRSG